MKIDQELKDNINIWIKALRSGEYEQTVVRLQNSNGYCCLGVACRLFIAAPNLGDNGYLDGNIPNKAMQPDVPSWLENINNDFKERTDQSLTGLNDNGVSFNEIADQLEAVYITETWSKK